MKDVRDCVEHIFIPVPDFLYTPCDVFIRIPAVAGMDLDLCCRCSKKFRDVKHHPDKTIDPHRIMPPERCLCPDAKAIGPAK